MDYSFLYEPIYIPVEFTYWDKDLWAEITQTKPTFEELLASIFEE